MKIIFKMLDRLWMVFISISVVLLLGNVMISYSGYIPVVVKIVFYFLFYYPFIVALINWFKFIIGVFKK